MKRWAINIIAGVSLLLCVAVVVLWIRSYWRQDAALMSRYGATSSYMSSGGKIEVQAYIFSGVSLGLQDGIEYHSRKILDSGQVTPSESRQWPQPLQPDLTYWGFGFHHSHNPARIGSAAGFIDIYWAVIPHWAAALVTLSPFALLVVPNWYRRTRRIASGLCPVCGYDLRATPERCPECGTMRSL